MIYWLCYFRRHQSEMDETGADFFQYTNARKLYENTKQEAQVNRIIHINENIIAILLPISSTPAQKNQ